MVERTPEEETGAQAAAPEPLAERVNNWIREQGLRMPECPVSGKRNWTMGDHVVEVRRYGRGPVVAEGPVYPLVMLVCRDCGYTYFMNAAVMKVL